MPNLDLTTAQAVRFGNQTAVAVRIANTTIWTAPATAEHSVWWPSAYPYTLGRAVFAGSNVIYSTAFYTNDAAATDTWIVGARIWVPAGTVSTSVAISLFNSLDVIGSAGFTTRFQAGDVSTWLDAPTETVTVAISGTGWHTVRFTRSHKATLNAPFTIGYVLSNPAEAIWVDGITSSYVAATDGYKVGMSQDATSGRNVRSWKKDRAVPLTDFNTTRGYGLDVIVSSTEPTPLSYSTHSVLGAAAPPSGWLPQQTQTDFSTNGWLGSNFYTEGPLETGWKLKGGRLWVPAGSGHIGQSARMGYFFEAGTPIANNTGPISDVITGWNATATSPITLVAGWNEILLPTPVAYSWHDGIAIGWKIGSGNRYFYTAGDNIAATGINYRSRDGSPLFLAAENAGPGNGERRGENGVPGVSADWAYLGAWYHADVIMSRPVIA